MSPIFFSFTRVLSAVFKINNKVNGHKNSDAEVSESIDFNCIVCKNMHNAHYLVLF